MEDERYTNSRLVFLEDSFEELSKEVKSTWKELYEMRSQLVSELGPSGGVKNQLTRLAKDTDSHVRVLHGDGTTPGLINIVRETSSELRAINETLKKRAKLELSVLAGVITLVANAVVEYIKNL